MRDPARILGIDDRYGTLEPGKVADLVLYDGDPFEHTTHVTFTLMDGRVVYDRAGYLKLGGFKLGYLLNFHVAHMRDGIVRMVNAL